MKSKSLVSIDQCSKEDILRILDNARKFEENPNRKLLEGKVAATLFFEPSTRTRLSFETAVNRLGGRVIGFSDASTTSSSKGETLKDTILMVSNYVDLIIMRHHLEGAARYASEVTDVPIINAGDGANQHPSQTMLDLYSIRKTQGKLDNLTITMVGDLKYGRTVHSLIVGMSHFHPTFHFVAPNELRMPDEQKNFCDKHGLKYEEHTDFTEDIINQTDILYMTRVQRERFTDLEEYERVKNVYILRNDMLRNSRENLRILHPLPRVNEIAYDVDDNPKAYYIQQARNGLFARQAIICEVLGISIDEYKRSFMSAEKKKELQVAALENGTAIDHIPPSQLFKVASLLGLEKMNNTITIGNNFHSNKMGCKGMIKIADKFFEEDEINRIAMIAPNIILNIIRDYEVVEKKTVTLPDELIGLVKCNNPKCITNNEPMLSRFHVIDKEKGTIKCHYCERKINKEDIIIK